MAKQLLIISGFTGMNRSLQPHQLNPTKDGDARLHELANCDPSELRELTPRPAWRPLAPQTSANLVWPRRVDLLGQYRTD